MIMKKHLVLAACVGVALTSCVNDEKLDVLSGSRARITFSSPVSGANTRTVYGEMTKPYSKIETFQVYGLQHVGNYAGTGWDTGDLMIKDKTVKYNDTYNGWETENETYFWPADKLMTFGAYSPTQVKTDVTSNSGTITYDETGLKITGFSVADDIAKQYDLMYSEVARNKNGSPTSATGGYNGVDINFHHALSSVNIYVKLADNVSSGAIRNVKIKGVKFKADFGQNVEWDSATSGTMHTKGAPAWTNRASETKDYTVLIDEIQATNTPTRIHNTSMILLPQSFVGIAEAIIELDYKLAHNPWVNNETVVINTLTQEWIMAKRYNYTVVIGGSGVTPIYFAPSEVDWTNADAEIKLP